MSKAINSERSSPTYKGKIEKDTLFIFRFLGCAKYCWENGELFPKKYLEKISCSMFDRKISYKHIWSTKIKMLKICFLKVHGNMLSNVRNLNLVLSLIFSSLLFFSWVDSHPLLLYHYPENKVRLSWFYSYWTVANWITPVHFHDLTLAAIESSLKILAQLLTRGAADVASNVLAALAEKFGNGRKH